MAAFNHVKILQIEEMHLLSKLGLAICVWSHVEDSLCDVLLAAIQPPDKASLVETYYAVPSVENKTRMVNAAMKVAAKHKPTLLTQWSTLLNRLNRKRKLRNELAHCQVIGHYRPQIEVFLVPYFNLHNYQRVPGLNTSEVDPESALKRLFANDIRQRQESFYALALQLDEFAKVVALELGTKPKAPRPRAAQRVGSRSPKSRTPRGN